LPELAPLLAALGGGDVALERAGLVWPALAALGALLAWAGWRGPRRVAVPGALGTARGLDPDPAFWLSMALRGAALGLLVAALLGPVAQLRDNPASGEGVDLVIALDASGSMNALDAVIDGRRATRFELARQVVADFVRQRRGDRVGLVVFGERAFTQSPLTVDHRLVLDALARVRVGVAGDQTAIGEALGLATRRLEGRGAVPGAQRVLLLITDGRQNAGRLAPETAAEIARQRGVRVHTVGIGSSGVVPFARGGRDEPLRFERVDLDPETLRRIASATGGRFYHARQPGDLVEIAAAIDALEVRPAASEPRLRQITLVPLCLALVLGLLLTDGLARFGPLRRLP